MKNFKLILMCLLLFSVSMTSAFAQPAQGGGTNIGSMFAAFKDSAIQISILINVAAYIIGAYLIINSIFKFIKANQQGGSFKGAIVTFLCGVALFAITGSISMALETMAFAQATGPGEALLATGTDGMSGAMQEAMTGVLTFMKMVGYLAFVRGWLLLVAAGNGKDGTLGKGLIHIFGGVALINVTFTAKLVGNTIAPGVPIPGIT